jgi:hypothetical protein
MGQTIFRSGQFISLCYFDEMKYTDPRPCLARVSVEDSTLSFQRYSNTMESELSDYGYLDPSVVSHRSSSQNTFSYQNFLVFVLSIRGYPFSIWICDLDNVSFVEHRLKEISDGNPFSGVVLGDVLYLFGEANIWFNFQTLESGIFQLDPVDLVFKASMTRWCVLNDTIWGISSLGGEGIRMENTMAIEFIVGDLKVFTFDPIHISIRFYEVENLNLACFPEYISFVPDQDSKSLILSGALYPPGSSLEERIKVDFSMVYVIPIRKNVVQESFWILQRQIECGDCTFRFD